MTTTDTTDTGSTTLEDFFATSVSPQRYTTLPARCGRNLGYPTFTVDLDIGMLLDQTRVGNDAAAAEDPTGDGMVTQRPLNVAHATKMAAFNLGSLLCYMEREAPMGKGKKLPPEAEAILEHLGRQEYYSWAPVVCSVRDSLTDVRIRKAEYYNKEGKRVKTDDREIDLKTDTNIWVVDGQHRRYGFQLAGEWLKKIVEDRKFPRVKAAFPAGLGKVPEESVAFWREVKKALWHDFTITVELHFGLKPKQERQLFYFLNDLPRAVPSSISHSFDSGNAINRFTNSLLESGLIAKSDIESANPVHWDDDAWLRLDSLNSINARMFLNATSMDNANSTVVNPRVAEGTAFWEAVMQIPNVTDRKKSVAAQPAMLKAMARAYYDICWGRGHGALPEGTAEKFLQALPFIDFSHKNPLWRLDKKAIQNFTTGRVTTQTLEECMPSNWATKSIGSTDAQGCFRYDSRHNEILVLLAQILRYVTGTM